MLKFKKSDYETKFKEINYEKIINELEIEKKALKEGELNLPLETDIDLDVNEFTIKRYMLDKVKEANELVINKKTVYNNILFRITEATNKINEIINLPEKYRNECEHYLIHAKEEYSSQQKKFLALEKDLRNFKSENKIEREEISTKNRVLSIAILIFIVLVESIVNSTFFAKANDLGLLGGFVQASIISGINLGLAYSFVILFRYKNKIKLSNIQKNTYYLLLAFLIIFVFSFHLLTGHFRDGLSIDPENAYIISINNFFENPFTLMTLDSWLLIGVGLILFFLFIFDLKSFKDPYPGYTEITKRYEFEKNKFDNIKSKILDEIKVNEEEIEKNLKSSILFVKNIFNESRDIPNFKKDLEAKYKEHITHLENTYTLLIKKYRSINLANRKTAKPKYFDNKLILDGYEKIQFEIDLDIQKIEKLEKIVNNIVNTEALTFKRITEITTSQIKLMTELING